MRQFLKLSCVALGAVSAPVEAGSLTDGTYAVYVEDNSKDRIRIAQINVRNGAYTVDMEAKSFSDHFLSMRPFKCLDGSAKTWCHVPYPYDIARDITVDLTDLEYDFLFVWKGSSEYGINMWNGVYYQLTETAHGGLKGVLHEMDMDILSAPPDDGTLRPIREVDLEPGEPDSHWLPVLVIE